MGLVLENGIWSLQADSSGPSQTTTTLSLGGNTAPTIGAPDADGYRDLTGGVLDGYRTWDEGIPSTGPPLDPSITITDQTTFFRFAKAYPPVSNQPLENADSSGFYNNGGLLVVDEGETKDGDYIQFTVKEISQGTHTAWRTCVGWWFRDLYSVDGIQCAGVDVAYNGATCNVYARSRNYNDKALLATLTSQSYPFTGRVTARINSSDPSDFKVEFSADGGSTVWTQVAILPGANPATLWGVGFGGVATGTGYDISEIKWARTS